MQTWTDPLALQAEALRRRARGERIGFVPTMGFLHAGHTSLMDIARERCDWLVVSIFVNPLQFAPEEDLAQYPRDPEGDAAQCRQHGVDAILQPRELYAEGHGTRVNVTGPTQGLCGADRPSHFEGVTTVVARLLGLVQPHVTVFGEKDFQQLVVVRRMVRDLAMPVEVLGGPLVRDEDGVALSSRNAYLSPAERVRARTISAALRAMAQAARAGERDARALLALGRARLDVDELDYLEIRDEHELAPLTHLGARPARAFAAARVGRPRLIDNLSLPVLS
ncbi:MAG: pantoate--beta-alanine ligase [Myxococcota bacterium]|nr:pantoate--beta-alanine ligase [Myxococcota bacterium]MEC8423322.1 pantoate--beta-alanine ligase [Myxococcota bacterium]